MGRVTFCLMLGFLARVAAAADVTSGAAPQEPCPTSAVAVPGVTAHWIDAEISIPAAVHERGKVTFTYTDATDAQLLRGRNATAVLAVSTLRRCKILPSVPATTPIAARPIVTLHYEAGPAAPIAKWPDPKPGSCGQPAYPPQHIKNDIQATVTARMLVSEEGKLLSQEIESVPDIAEFKEAAAKAFATCAFSPARLRSGAAVPAYASVQASFTLQ